MHWLQSLIHPLKPAQFLLLPKKKKSKSNLISKLTGCNLIVLILLFYIKMIISRWNQYFYLTISMNGYFSLDGEILRRGIGLLIFLFLSSHCHISCPWHYSHSWYRILYHSVQFSSCNSVQFTKATGPVIECQVLCYAQRCTNEWGSVFAPEFWVGLELAWVRTTKPLHWVWDLGLQTTVWLVRWRDNSMCGHSNTIWH